MYAFDYERASDVAHAIRTFGTREQPQYLAGGQTLLASMKMRLTQPDALIDLGRIDSLKALDVTDGAIRVGAMVTHATIAQSGPVRLRAPWLCETAEGIGDPMVRHRGTIGGSLANNDPAADWPAATLALGATVVTDRRRIGADDFFLGMFSTALQPGEVITAVEFPGATRAAYAKFRNPASRYAVVGVFVARSEAGVRVAITGAGPCVFRHSEMERRLTLDFRPESLEGVHVHPTGLNSDLHATAQYRAHLVRIFAGRAVRAALRD